MEQLFQELFTDPIRLVLALVLIVGAIVLFVKLTGALLQFAVQLVLISLLVTVIFGGFEWIPITYQFIVDLFTGKIIDVGLPEVDKDNLPI